MPHRGKSRGSLKTQLILVSVVTTVLAWMGGIALALAATRAAMEQLHDRELREIAVLLHGLSGHELIEVGDSTSIAERIANAHADTDELLGGGYRYQIWSTDGRLLLTNFGLPSAAPMSKFGSSGLSWLQMDGARWRVYADRSRALGQEVHIAERESLREITPDLTDRSFVIVVLCSLLVALGPAFWLSGWLMQPLQDLVSGLSKRSATNLAPLQVRHPPADIEPVVGALNQLFVRVAETLRHEAAFTALAAHELRTPLATVSILAESIKTTADEQERQRMVDELIVSTDRCARLQDQLLTLSRLDTARGTDLNQEVELAEVVVDLVSDLMPEARRKGIKLASRLDGSAIRGHRFGVLTLLRNLMANAIRYTPDGGRVEVVTLVQEGEDDDEVVVTVDDSGPGIPEAERERVFERFERLQRDQATGVGLGLSIVRTVADMHDATVALSDSPLGGLRVTVTFVGRALDRELIPDPDSAAYA